MNNKLSTNKKIKVPKLPKRIKEKKLKARRTKYGLLTYRDGLDVDPKMMNTLIHNKPEYLIDVLRNLELQLRLIRAGLSLDNRDTDDIKRDACRIVCIDKI